MKANLAALSAAVALAVPLSAGAIDVAGEKLEVYGKLHVSIDYSNRNDPTSNDGMSVSSNSSRLGFKGKMPLENGMKLIWQVEQEVRWDDGSKGNFADRNSYLGLTMGAHSMRAGVYDTPFKSVASKWGVFGDSIGERRAILGAGYKSGNKLNERSKNVVMYQYDSQPLKIQAMYAVDPQNQSGAVDNNDASVFGAGAWWKIAGLMLSAGYENWRKHSAIEDGSAFRLASVYRFGTQQIGVIYEKIDSDTASEWKRAAYGVNWRWKFSGYTDFRAQYLIVDDADGMKETGSRKTSLGVFHKLDKKAEIYVAYASTDNEVNAKFQVVDGGHGDEVKTVLGGSPKSVSLGLVYKF